MNALVVNFYAGPGSGKTTLSAHTFAMLKWCNINCELAFEYAKDLVWSESFRTLDNQFYVFGKQQHRLYRLADKVDVIITDAPLLNSIHYDAKNDAVFRSMINQEYKKYENLNFFVNRAKPYNPKGRIQTAEEAKLIDVSILKILNTYDPDNYEYIPGNPEEVEKTIVPLILERLEKRNENANSTNG